MRKKIVSILIIFIVVLTAFTACDNSGVKPNRPTKEAKGYLSVSVPPVRNSRGITNAQASSICDDYVLHVVYADDNIATYTYSEREDGFSSIPMDAGTYELILFALSYAPSTNAYSTDKYGIVVGTAYADNVVVQQYQMTSVSMTLETVQFSFTFSNQEHYAASNDSVHISFNRTSAISDRIWFGVRANFIKEDGTVASVSGNNSLGMIFSETTKSSSAEVADELDITFVLPEETGTYSIAFTMTPWLKHKEGGYSTDLRTHSGDLYSGFFSGYEGSYTIDDLAKQIYTTESFEVTTPPSGISLQVQWAED